MGSPGTISVKKISVDGQRIKRVETLWNIAENFSRLSRVHERYRQTTDGRATAYSERELTNKQTNSKQDETCNVIPNTQI